MSESIAPIVNDDTLEAALRAASAAMPPGPLLMYLLIVEGDEDRAVLSAASNFENLETKLRILTAERDRVLDAIGRSTKAAS